MYPDFSYFFHDVFGTEPDNWTAVFKTFGFFLFCAFIASGYILNRELRRKEREGKLSPIKVVPNKKGNSRLKEVIINGLIAAFLGYKVPFVIQNFDAFKADPASILFSAGGNILLGIIVGAAFGALLYYQSRNEQVPTEPYNIMPHNKLGDILTVAAIFGIIGAKTFSVLENLPAFFEDPAGVFFSGSGLNVLGGFIVAAFAVAWYTRKLGMPFAHIADAAAPAIITGYAVGRLGCQFSGDGDWGKINDLPVPDWFFLPDWAWSYSYPNNVSKQGVKMPDCDYTYCWELIPGAWPTPIYEVSMLAIIFAILWFLRKRVDIPGFLFFLYFLLYGIMRFLIEFVRVNDKYEILSMNYSQAQYISILFWFIGIGGMVYLYRKSKLTKNLA